MKLGKNGGNLRRYQRGVFQILMKVLLIFLNEREMAGRGVGSLILTVSALGV
ncbi:Unknown protein, partial [Striga hermonthica]